ncbi:MAG TPA: hypothetical protein VGM83_17910 [Devosiaceae bacterium]
MGLDRVLALESRRFGASLANVAEPLTVEAGGPAQLIVDLTGTMTKAEVPVLRLQFSGQRQFPAGLRQMLRTGQSPEIVAYLDDVAVGRARPMVSDRLWLSRSSNEVLSGAIALIEQTVARFAAGRITALAEIVEETAQDDGFLRHYLPFVARGIAGRLSHKLRMGRRPFYWQVAYRLIDGPGVAETGRLDGEKFTVLPDDGARFYADPFVIAQDGRHYLFVEEFPYATRKGVISVAELGADGRFGVPRLVLEEAHHLSYPQVFAHEGAVYMIPESSGGHEVVLYRAEQFPDRWVRDTVLLEGLDFNDATLLETGGRFWLVGTQRYGQGSASDTMAVYAAPSLRGPWSAHALNPVAIDHSATRPGGALISRNGRLVLPVQNGSESYGGGLGLMELALLDDGAVVFTTPEPVRAGPAWDRAGIHTLNRVGRLEVVDSAG